jgi:mRNA interferase MazF
VTVWRGDIVLASYPFTSGTGTKKRPVLIVQNDRDNQRLANTIVAQITSNTRRGNELTHLLIPVASPAG